MKVITFIYERKVIKKILDHLGFSEEVGQKRERAPPSPAEFVETNIEPYDDGLRLSLTWPDYEESFVGMEML